MTIVLHTIYNCYIYYSCNATINPNSFTINYRIKELPTLIIRTIICSLQIQFGSQVFVKFLHTFEHITTVICAYSYIYTLF